MLDNLKQSFITLRQYMGDGLLVPLAVIALIYLLISKDDMRKKLAIAVAPALTLVIFLFPVTRKVFIKVLSADNANTYYRLLWMVPWTIIIAYAACKLFSAHRRIGLVLTSMAVVLCGKLVYTNQYVSRAENLYHIPQSVIEVCDVIRPAEGQDRIRALFPSEMIHFVRQYDTNILMPYGREIIASQWGWYNELHVIYELTDPIDAEALVAATRQTQCDYIVLNRSRPIDRELSELGLTLIYESDLYRIYMDPEVYDGI